MTILLLSILILLHSGFYLFSSSRLSSRSFNILACLSLSHDSFSNVKSRLLNALFSSLFSFWITHLSDLSFTFISFFSSIDLASDWVNNLLSLATLGTLRTSLDKDYRMSLAYPFAIDVHYILL
jgi:hypothetical protein